MADLTLTFTNAGIAEVVNAENNGLGPVLVSEVGIGSGQYTPSDTQTSLQNEIKRLNTLTGGAVADDVIHVTVRDESEDVYQIYEFGLYLDSGTLLAVYSQTGSAVLDKNADSIMLLAADIKVSAFEAASLTFGDTNFLVSQATTEQQGIAELATNAETQTGTDNERIVTPAGLSSRTATTTRTGLVELATNTETQTGTDSQTAVTPAALNSRVSTSDRTGLIELATQTEAEQATDNQRAMTPLRVKQSIVEQTPNVADKDYRLALLSFADLEAHQTYHIASNATFTLPNVVGLSGGATIVLTKSIYNAPTIEVHGGQGENIRIGRFDGSQDIDTAISFDINCEIVLVWNSTSWEV